jgi:hypothetical protein
MRLATLILGFLLALVGLQPSQAAVDVRINLSTQTMNVRSSSGETYAWPVSTARSGYVTPRGSYRSQRLARMHYSRKYDMAPMPHSIFFRGGYAIHGTNAVGALGRPASHGCVRLAPGNAARLYSMVQREGARITIVGSAPHSMTASKASKKRYAKSRHSGQRYAAAKSKRHYASARRAMERGYGMQMRGAYEPALGYAQPSRQPTMRQWLRAPSW